MKLASAFILLFIICCKNPTSTKTVIVSTNDTTQIDTSFSTVKKDSLNLVSSKDIHLKRKALLGLWHLTMFLMIDKNGTKTELLQPQTTMEFFDTMNWVSHANGFTAEGIWDYNDLNILTTSSEKLNGSIMESKITQKNKVIYLSRDSLIYLYNDPVTASTLEMHYKK